MDKEGIKKNVEMVLQQLEGHDTQLLAATKTRTPEEINWAIECGVRHIGENRVQELLEKYEAINKAQVQIHLIGRLQTNKVKYIIDKVDLIHSVDSARLAAEISKRALAFGKTQDILLEVNIGGEASKGGVAEQDIPPILEEISSLSGIRVRGLMCIPPPAVKKHQNREYFFKMHQLLVDIKAKKLDNIHMDILSMGMSNDYEDAIDAGSSFIRIGRGIFGARN